MHTSVQVHVFGIKSIISDLTVVLFKSAQNISVFIILFDKVFNVIVKEGEFS